MPAVVAASSPLQDRCCHERRLHVIAHSQQDTQVQL
jgi:hypothetical protein